MKNIKIYQLQEDLIVEKMPQLITKASAGGEGILLICETESEKQALDKKLWVFSQEIFLPHATEDDDFLEQNQIVISTKTINVNNPKIIVSTSRTIDGFMSMLNSTHDNLTQEATSILWMTCGMESKNLMQEVEEGIANSPQLKGSLASIKYYKLQNNTWHEEQPSLL
jgi:DNA polymerase IIIc chi subunit